MTSNSSVPDRETHPLVPERVGTAIELYLSTADRVASAIWAISLAMATVLTLIVITQVVTRYLLGYITTWGNELARYLMIWFAMLLLGVLTYSDDHLQVEIGFQKLSPRAQRVLRSVELLVIVAFATILTRYGYEWTTSSGFFSTTPALDPVTPFEFHMAYVYAVVPLGGALLAFFAIGKLLEINYYPDTIRDDYASRFEVEEEATDGETSDEEATDDEMRDTGPTDDDRADGEATDDSRREAE